MYATEQYSSGAWDGHSYVQTHAALVVAGSGCLVGTVAGTFRVEEGKGRSGDRGSRLDEGPPPPGAGAADPNPRSPFWTGGCGGGTEPGADGEKSISWKMEQRFILEWIPS